MTCNHRIAIFASLFFTLTVLAGAIPSHATGAPAAIHYRMRTRTGHRATYYKYHIQYPVFAGSSPLAAYANQAVQKWVAKTKRDFQHDANQGAHDGILNLPWELYDTAEVTFSRSDLISLSFHDYYFAGGANGSESPHLFNFGLRDGRPSELQLSDLFAGPKPLDILSPVVMKTLRQKGASFVLDGTVKSLDSVYGDWGWHLNDKKQVIVEIAQEAVSYHAQGPFSIHIPLTTFAGKLNTHGPLSGYLRGN